ncbi:SHOCT domain-containing protein [Modestobacter marinus]|nr:SHOCT domain-containing protein [Modestobacter marinus]NIH69272.1 putative membrane protein [Modestobacter marinus]
MGWMLIFGLLLIVGLTLVVVVVVRAIGGGVHRKAGPTHADDRPRRSRAREVLDERYARGELTTEEYRARLTALEEHE